MMQGTGKRMILRTVVQVMTEHRMMMIVVAVVAAAAVAAEDVCEQTRWRAAAEMVNVALP